MKDLISQLPNELQHKILMNLKTRESVRTSVLSTRWRHLWESVHGLFFDSSEPDVLDFLDRFLSLHKELSIYQFTSRCFYVDIPRMKLLIDQVLTRRVQLLTVDGFLYKPLGVMKLPVSFHRCETLVNLHLKHVKLNDFDGSEFVNLPCLQIMRLEFVLISSDVVLEMLISCSSVLQELRLCHMNVGRMKVRSQTLKRLSLTMLCKEEYTLLGDGRESRVVINTPNLEVMNIRHDPLESFTVESVSSSIKLCLHVSLSKMQTLHKFFARNSLVTYLSISGYTLKEIYPYYKRLHQQLPEFKNLTRLYAIFYPNISEMLPLFLSSCPNLKSIDLDLYGYPKMEKITNSPIPQCLQTSIENVNIKMMPMGWQQRIPMGWQQRSRKAEIKFAKYILENARALKKLTLWLDEEDDVRSCVLEQIIMFQNSPFVDVNVKEMIGYVRRKKKETKEGTDANTKERTKEGTDANTKESTKDWVLRTFGSQEPTELTRGFIRLISYAI